MNKLLKKTLKILLPVALGGFILYWVYRDFDFARAKEVLLHGTNWGWMLFSLFFGVMSHVFRGWRWKQTLAPLGAYPKSGDCVDAIFVSYAANLILPRVGEVSRCGVLAKYDDVSFAKSLGTVVTERLIDTLTILLITGITFLIQMPVFLRFFEETGTKVPSLVHLVTSPWFYVVLFSIIGVLVLLYFLLRMLSFFEKVKGVVLNVWEGVMSLKSVKNIPLFILYTLLIWICYFYHFYITFYCFSFTEHLSFLAGLVMFVGGTTGNVWGDAVFAATQAANMPVFLGSLLDEVVVDVPDKLITLIMVFFILKGLPNKLTTLYEVNSEIETLE